MELVKQTTLPLGRMLFIPRDGNLTRDDLEIEASGSYQFLEKPDCFIIKNDDCCRSILVTVRKKEK
ncbi:MAG: hypothetical protein QHH05_04715 [Syntrophomonadaceae bacterium]|nr:hypothetical protein [Syntrophomonadaceae bacterium]